jgi:FKBP-type peptidyl-prolyl cis-trans isomerase
MSMKRFLALVCVLGVFIPAMWFVLAGEEPPARPPAANPDLESAKGRLSYALGLDTGAFLQGQETEIDADAFCAGLRDGLGTGAPKIAAEEARRLVEQDRQRAAREAASRNLKAGKKFLEENRMKEGVKVTASGLQYEVLKEGDGPRPAPTDRVTVHYRGTLLNGKEFDSSYGRGQATTFPLNRVIPGWTEGLQLMKVGSKFRFFIPPNLAYGERGAGNVIGPNETLVFEVELLSIN